MTYKICAFCRFWQAEKPAEAAAEGGQPADGVDRRAKSGLCRRLAPRPGPSTYAVEWPRTAQRDWCGEFEGRDIEYRSQTQGA